MANNIEKLLAVLCTPIQDLENTLQQLKLFRSIDTATGAQLDIIGRLAGEYRNGLLDEDFRRRIRARIATHNSDGTVEDLLTIAELVVYDDDVTYVLSQEGTATARLFVDGEAITEELGELLFSFIHDAKSGGVRIVVQWMESEPSGIFQFDSGPGYDQGRLSTSRG